MKDVHMETLSRLFDGEFVEPEALAEALDAPGAAMQLVGFARLRAMVQADTSEPGREFYERIERQLRPHGFRRLVGSRMVRLAAAATLFAGVFLAGWQMNGRDVVRPSGVVGSTADLTQGVPAASRTTVLATPEEWIGWRQTVVGTSR